MEDKSKLIESLLERATDYGNTSFELVKLKAVDKTSDVASSLVPHAIAFILFASAMFFLNLGLAFWLGEIFGSVCLGFFVVAAFYSIMGIIMHFFMHERLKNYLYNYIIKQVLK